MHLSMRWCELNTSLSLNKLTFPPPQNQTESQMYEIEADRTMEENEEVFNAEVPLDNKVYSWQDKYRPRKPRYFNRVHTGYEWNKYNQSHYVSTLSLATFVETKIALCH